MKSSVIARFLAPVIRRIKSHLLRWRSGQGASSEERGKLSFGHVTSLCDISETSDRQLDIGTDVHGISWMGHINLRVISIKGVFKAMILDETIEGASVDRDC